MQYFLGIDGGQSSTTILIGDEDGHLAGSSRSGPCNHVSAPEAAARFREVISGGLVEACRSASLDFNLVQFRAACCGMSGGPDDKAELIASVVRAEQLAVTDDGEIALIGAMAGGPGIVVIAGTGSIAYARDSSGTLFRAGGWGYVFGDEGSAFDIARQAVRAACRFEEGWGQETAITSALLKATGAQSINQVLHLIYTPDWPRSRVASFAPAVDRLCRDGDTVACSILEGAAQSLAALATALPAQKHVAYIGGVFQSVHLLAQFRSILERTGEYQVVAPRLQPAAGALLEAYRLADRSPDLVTLGLYGQTLN